MKKSAYIILLLLVLTSLGYGQTTIKLSELPEDTAPGTDSLVVTVDDPSGTPVAKRATLGNLLGSGLSSIRSLTLSDGMVLYYYGGSFGALTAGTSGYVLRTQGTSAAPYWGMLSYTDVGAAASGHNHSGTYDPAGTAAGLISDTAYDTGWDTDTTHAPSKNAVYDKISSLGPSDVGAAASVHAHAATDVTSGTLDNARVNWAVPGAIGGTTPAAGTFTTISTPKTSGVAGQSCTFTAYLTDVYGTCREGPDGHMTANLVYKDPEAAPAGGVMTYPAPTNGKTQAAWLTIGTAASNLVQLDGSARLPAVNGSQLTNLPVPDLASPGPIGGTTPGTVTGTVFQTPQAATSGATQDQITLRGYGTNGRGFYLKNPASEPASTFGFLVPTTEPTAGQALVVSSFATHEGQLGYATLLGYPGAGIAVSATSSWGTSLTAPSGAIVGTTDTQTLSGKTLTAAKETVVPGGTCSTSYTPDLTAGSMFTLTLNGACQIANPTLAAGESFIIKLTQSSTVAPTWGNAFKWAAGTAPTWSTSATKYDVVACVSFEGTALLCGSLIDVR